ncbi:MAG: endo-1,4-beta-xylanase [Bacteroidales bacterium]|nr:endo-1,4-beta-xylanase [Bacteroidales bacterium]
MEIRHLSKIALAAFGLTTVVANAQLSSNPEKFLGNITTYGSIDTDGYKYYELWNQITPENESKWESIEGRSRGNFSFTSCDKIYNYAKEHNFPFKFHTLVWGSQYPSWMNNLSKEKQYEAIVEWFDAVKERYPDIDMIDVVNEAVAGHAPAPYKEALGGDGKTGYDWIIKAFEMAYERWPNAILIYNDYNTFQWQKTEFINLVKTLRDAGAPIDAYGCQSHDLTDIDFETFKAAMDEIQSELKLPMYSTEYDIGTTDDAKQLKQYKDQIPYMWEADYVAGVTLWGFIYGKTWTNDGKDKNGNTINAGHSGIIKNRKDRPAMEWLREYMATDAAKKAKSPFPGCKKEASIYVKPASIKTPIGETTSINVRASLSTKTIKEVKIYANDELIATATEAPYIADYTPTEKGNVTLKAVVSTTDGTTFERISNIYAHEPRSTFKGAIDLPGVIELENFDAGGEGVSFHDSDSKNEGDAEYRDDNEGIDIVKGNGGMAIGYTANGEWLEYTVKVTEDNVNAFTATVSSGSTGSGFKISAIKDDKETLLAQVSVPNTGSWDTYKTVEGKLKQTLEAGEYVIRVTITGAYCNLDKIAFGVANAIVDIIADEEASYEVYTTAGVKVGAFEASGRDDFNKQFNSTASKRGLYVVKNLTTGKAELLMSK